MADFTDQNIQDTYQRVVQIDSGQLQDGTGSVILSSTELTSIQAIGDSIPITSTEWNELKNIGGANISSTEWEYVASMQNVSTVSTPVFSRLILNGAGGLSEPILSYPSSGSQNNPHIGVTRGSSMYFHELGNPQGLAISFTSHDGTDLANMRTTGTLHNLLGNAAADTANTAANLVGLNTSDIVTTNTTQTITSVKTIETSTKLQFRDSGIYLNSNTDGKLQIVSDDKVNIFGNNVKAFAPFTASGDISASGDLISRRVVVGLVDTLRLSEEYATGNFIIDDNAGGNVNALSIYADNFIPQGNMQVLGSITASGNISASGTIEADLYQIQGQNAIDYTANTHLFGNTAKYTKLRTQKGLEVTAPITASGDISASGRIYGRQLEQIETNFGYDFDDGTFVYLPFSNQSTIENAAFSNTNVNRVAVVPGKPIKSIMRATGNALGNNTPYTMSYWEAAEGDPTTPVLKAAVYADTDGDSNKDAVRFDWSSPNSGSTTDVAEGSRIWMSLESNNSANAGYIITHLWEWDYNSV